MALEDTITNLGESIINLVNTRADKSLSNLDAAGEKKIGSGGGGGGVKPSICKNLNIKVDGTNVQLKWEDPGDTVIDRQVLSSWAGTLIVKKEGSFPKNETDGTIVVDNTTKNAYLDTPYTDTIESGKEFYYTAFPYNKEGGYTYNDKNNFVDAIIYEFTINL